MDNYSVANDFSDSYMINKTLFEVVKSMPWYLSVTWVLRIIFIAGLFGNAFILISSIVNKLYIKNSIFIFFSFMAVCDIISLLTFNGVDELEKAGVDVGTPMFCRGQYYLFYSSTLTSVYTLVAAHISRLRSITTIKVTYKQSRYAVITCSAIATVFFLIFIYLLATAVMDQEKLVIIEQNTTVYMCSFNLKLAPYSIIFPVTYITLYAIIPAIMLSTMSVIMMVILGRKYRAQKRILFTHYSSPSDETKPRSIFVKAKILAALLIPISVIHILTTLAIYSIVLKFYTAPYNKRTIDQVFSYFIVSRFARPVNAGMNFYVQTATSKFFRQNIFGCCFCESKTKFNDSSKICTVESKL